MQNIINEIYFGDLLQGYQNRFYNLYWFWIDFLVFEFQLYFGFYVNEFYVIIPEKIIVSKVREGNIWHPWCSILSTRGKELLTTIPLKAQLSNSSRRLSISMLNYHIQYKFVVPCEIHVRILRASYCYNKDKWRLGMIVLKSIHIHMQNMFLFK